MRNKFEDSGGSRPLPEQPTDALPGSADKIQTMRERADRGEQLYHPQDRTFEGFTPTKLIMQILGIGKGKKKGKQK